MLGSNKPFKIGIIGCGRMGSSIARKLAPQQQVFICDKNPDKAKRLASEIGAQVFESIPDFSPQAQILILAIKPQNLGSVSSVLHEKLNHTQLLVSVLAGTTTATLKHSFGAASILRMMPNLALKYGQGVIGLTDDAPLSKEMKHNVVEVFSPLGNLHWMPESKLDALAALAASGQAYVYVMIESMIEAAIAMGFDPEQGRGLYWKC